MFLINELTHQFQVVGDISKGGYTTPSAKQQTLMRIVFNVYIRHKSFP